jgi:4-amino-4-deoxy-L-arabinose transferase-like glycosyltransferase
MAMTTATNPLKTSFLGKRILLGITLGALIVLAIMLLSLGLHLYKIDSIGDANAYYTAAVKSMLMSWKNFFFAAAEPGGSVTVDKPPLGLWIEAIFAYFLGVSGVSVSLPNILAGVFGIPLLYSMVKRHMGELAGIVAAFVLAITPVFVATNRNNTMDGLLVFFLLVAAWAFIQAAETSKFRWLLLGAFVVGLGFNIKMMQAFLPLPAFYAFYIFSSKEGWLRKTINLVLASALLIAVSLSWAVVVDLTPADQRPYIGSSGNNTVMGLIFGHNGISRLESGGGQAGGGLQNGQMPPTAPQAGLTNDQGTQPQQGDRQNPPQEALNACASSIPGSSCSFNLQNGNTINGFCITPPNQEVLVCAPQGNAPQNRQVPANPQTSNGVPDGQVGGTPFNQETGEPGIFRFFTRPLSKQMSWLLPFALFSILIALFGSRIKLPIESGVHKALILWGGWLLTCVVFFSMISGIFHSYYAIMLVPALGAMVGIGFAQLWSLGEDNKWIGVGLALFAALTIGFQFFATNQYNETSWWMLGSIILFGFGILLLVFKRRLAFLLILAAMMVIPLFWTIKTATTNADQNLPTAYSGGNQQPVRTDLPRQQPGANRNSQLINYLEANTRDVDYLVAVPSSQQGAQLVLATGRPVLYLGGFGGGDNVVSADELGVMVANNKLRYVYYGGDRGGNAEIATWLKSTCEVIPEFSQSASGNQAPMVQGPNGQPGQGGQAMTLYLCK